ncbi:type II secretion system F family protein [Candidatus Gottesmanbacteria bacterium]|nr:type II secretion system F family protein [Candidatus Gottesmanbacteria bacterium]
MKFKYKAHRPDDDRITTGERDAVDKFALSREMRNDGLVLISAEPVSLMWKFDIEYLNELIVRIKLHDKVIFANNLSAMIGAGLTISRALGVLEKQTKNFKFKKVIQGLESDINSGKSFNESLSKFPDVFSPIFIAMVAAGEESGNLTKSLKIIGDQLEKSYNLRRKVRGALSYPAVVIAAMFFIGVVMMTYVVPNLVATFREFKVDLPIPTQIIMFTSDILVNYGSYVLVVAFIFTLILYKLLKTEKGGRFKNFVALHLPLIGNITREMNTAIIARTMSSLLASGVNMVRAISITESVAGNLYYKEVLREAQSGVEKGLTLSSFFEKNDNLFPVLAGELTEVGEETGQLVEMLENVANFYEGEVDAVTKDISTIIEPALMVFIGVAVGFFAVSIIQPIYSLTTAI